MASYTAERLAVTPIKIQFNQALKKLDALFGHGLVLSLGVILLIGAVISLAALAFINSATPSTLTITSGPAGSTFQRNAEKYKKILAREGVSLKILPSGGSEDNLKKLSDPKSRVDVGFVLGGEAIGDNIDQLVSLGSISYQPLMIFYHGKTRELISDFRGLRLDIGPEGSGARSLALALLKANGMKEKDVSLAENAVSTEAVRAFLDNRIDAIFLMGDSTATEQMRQLLHAEDIHLFSFSQADGYTRRINYLNKLELPRGALDFGKDIPSDNIHLVGPTVELIARNNLHPALSDLLLDAAKEVHGAPGIFKKRGEFPAPLEHEYPISPDASRFYSSGKSFLYRTFPFWMAGLVARTLAVIVPLALLLIPALKLAPVIYRWRMESRIYRWYRALLEVERDAFQPAIDARRRDEILRQLDHIEHAVNKIVVPAAFGDLFYGLRGNINFVRQSVLSRHPSPPEDTPATPCPL